MQLPAHLLFALTLAASSAALADGAVTLSDVDATEQADLSEKPIAEVGAPVALHLDLAAALTAVSLEAHSVSLTEALGELNSDPCPPCGRG